MSTNSQSPFETSEEFALRVANEKALVDHLCGFDETKNNVCRLLRDAWLILEDGPDDSDTQRAQDKIGEAMALARIVCKELNLKGAQ